MNHLRLLSAVISISFVLCMTLHASNVLAACRVNDPDVSGTYSGECVAGVAHGKGIAKGRDVYIGEYKNGNAHGFGINIWGTGTQWAGDIYVGEWIYDERTGNDLYIVKGKYSLEGKGITHAGTCRVNDSDISGSYVGECVAGFAHGKGVAKGRNEYMGMFKNGNKHGKGAYLWGADTKIAGAVFIGESIDDNTSKGLLIINSEETITVENNLQTRIDEITSKAEAESKAFKFLLTSGTPEELYLAGVKYETASDYDHASTLYNQVISHFAKVPVALKAADRLLAIYDKLEMEKRDSAAKQRAAQESGERRRADAEGTTQREINTMIEEYNAQRSATWQSFQDMITPDRQNDIQKSTCRAQVATCKATCPKKDRSCLSSCSVSCY